jgi:glycosyltransferase involved in cell wall biosynthesis
MAGTVPALSVVIPAYNAARHLEGTLASVQRQTLHDWELLVIDDGSSDDTAAIAAALAAVDPRIRLLSGPNGGVSRARNRGARESRAPLIAFLDADDRWAPNALAEHLAHFQADPGLGVSFGLVELLTPEGQPTGKICRTPLRPLEAAELLAENLTITTSNWVVRRRLFEQVGGFLEGLNHSEDLEWLLRVRCTTPWRIQAVDRVLTYYRTTGGGLSSQLESMERGWRRMLEEVRRYAPADLLRREGSYALAVQLRYLAQRALRLGLPLPLACGYLRRALLADPRLLLRQPRPTLGLIATLMREAALGRSPGSR